jgi:heat shock protein HslJ
VRVVVALALVLLAAAVAAGCDGDEDDGSTAVSLEGTPWVLVSGLGLGEATGAAPSAMFQDGTVAGSTGCNRFTAPFSVDGDSLDIGVVASTRMACPPPGDAIERAYLSALDRVAGWSVDEGELSLSDADGGEVLRYAAATPAGEWMVTAFIQGDAFASPIVGTEITASFGPDGGLTGFAGCNTYTGTYETDGGGIEIPAPAATRKTCPAPAGVMEQEAAYLAALPTAVRFRTDGGSLELLSESDTGVVAYAKATTP